MEDQVPFPFENNQVAGPEMEQEPAYVTEEEEVEDIDEPDFSISEETNEEDEALQRSRTFHHTTPVWIWKTINSLVWIC